MSSFAPEPPRAPRYGASPLPAPMSADPFSDWLMTHRPLGDARRSEARRYIEAIVLRAVRNGMIEQEAVPVYSQGLWRRFREYYDDLRGPYSKGDSEDFRRAMNFI